MSTQMKLADPEQGWIDDVVDVDTYRLDKPGSEPWHDLVAGVRRDLAHTGAATLPGFLRPQAREAIACHIADAATHVPIREHHGTVYARKDLEAKLSPDDPRTVEQRWFAGHVTRDMIPPYAEAHRLYVSPLFKQFIAACVSTDKVFEYGDPLAGLVATVLPPGGQYPWHYDTNEFVVTIMIQKPERGGAFTYVKDLRNPGNENLDGLRQVLAGHAKGKVRTTNNAPGDLQLFLGRYSLHQVERVEGNLARHVLVLSYGDRPGVIGPLDRTRSVYGRVTEAHIVAAANSEAATSNDGLIL